MPKMTSTEPHEKSYTTKCDLRQLLEEFKVAVLKENQLELELLNLNTPRYLLCEYRQAILLEARLRATMNDLYAVVIEQSPGPDLIRRYTSRDVEELQLTIRET